MYPILHDEAIEEIIKTDPVNNIEIQSAKIKKRLVIRICWMKLSDSTRAVIAATTIARSDPLNLFSPRSSDSPPHQGEPDKRCVTFSERRERGESAFLPASGDNDWRDIEPQNCAKFHPRSILKRGDPGRVRRKRKLKN